MDIQEARKLVLQYLASLPEGRDTQLATIQIGVGDLYGKASGRSNQQFVVDGRQFLKQGDKATINEVVWDLIVERVLTVGAKSSANPDWPFLSLTEFGFEVVREQRWSPYDPDGYLKELREQAPGLDSLCHMYVEESLRCFRGGCYLATVVMLGAASEAIVNELFDRFVGALEAGSVPESSGARRKIEKEQSVFRRYAAFRSHFDSLAKPKLPSELGDDLNLQFDGVFNLIRFYRNDAGHPTGTQIERESAFTSLVLFVPYCKRVEDLIDWLAANSGRLNK